MNSTGTVAMAKARATTTAKRVADAEAKLDSIYAAAFSTSAGSAVLENLNHKLMAVVPPGTPETYLAHHEGGRFLIKNIINRINRGKTNV